MTGRALARLLGLLVLWSGVELLERVAYAAGVDDAATEADKLLAGLEDEDLHAHRWQPWHPVPGDTSRERRHCAVWGCTAVRDRVVDEDLADELEPADVSDVVWLHVVTFHVPEAPRAGECAC